MDSLNSLELNYREYETVNTFGEDNDSVSVESNDESDTSDKRKNLSDNLRKGENGKAEKYISLEKTKKIWAGTNEIINYKKKDILELNKTIYKYNNKEINVSNNNKVLNINNNSLENLDFLNELLSYVYGQKDMESPFNYSNITSVDISFNDLTQISNNLLMLQNLKVLYLHSNKIEHIDEVKKLQSLSKLRKLTVENNPIMDMYGKFYRSFVIHYLPQIKSLDFHDITKIEKNKSDIAFNTHKYKFNLQ
ncbi:leucine-rich repeat protein, putative [Plasmodium ovale]|uniref:Leucine-rich repeat-containing protein 51 n=2 Tax=Plasmodium ovale TaxID=36330 RepID=A0A1A8X7I5_PLAOA|nr:leucine-rich repeat protein (LRR14.1) [Plasmodium ovale curtisi]SBT01221.1 leucine-rich repeat protein (LRR14.1) [Plasmodium ovale curtisi]SCP05599.1 leucine-rich repeat protein, putative [Plasmodium ovale]